MKRLLLICVILFASISVSLATSARDIFSINEELVYAEMADLFALEAHVTSSNATLTDLSLTNSPLVSNLASSNGIMGLASMAEPPLGIPSFVWGCCLGIPGLVVVYFVAEDKAETRKALWGCIVGNLVYTATYVIYYVYYLSLYTTY